MTILYLLPAISGFLLLALHFFRSDNLPAIFICFLMLSLMGIRRPWVAHTLQVCLLIGAAEWIRTTTSLVIARNEDGEPFLRLSLILGAVAIFTLFSALVFRTKRIRSYFNNVRTI